MTREEVRVYNASQPAGNKSMEAARRLKSKVVVYDPNFM